MLFSAQTEQADGDSTPRDTEGRKMVPAAVAALGRRAEAVVWKLQSEGPARAVAEK